MTRLTVLSITHSHSTSMSWFCWPSLGDSPSDNSKSAFLATALCCCVSGLVEPLSFMSGSALSSCNNYVLLTITMGSGLETSNRYTNCMTIHVMGYVHGCMYVVSCNGETVFPLVLHSITSGSVKSVKLQVTRLVLNISTRCRVKSSKSLTAYSSKMSLLAPHSMQNFAWTKNSLPHP